MTNSGYMLSVMWEWEWDNLVRENSEIKEHVESYSLISPMTPEMHYTKEGAKHLICMLVVLTHM